MARTAKERTVKEATVRRNEILDVAQRLVQTRGYEQMAIQDILDQIAGSAMRSAGPDELRM